ncbi:MAG: ComEC/Rec2 family competence protein, partial [Nocardioidaceae bacterium]
SVGEIEVSPLADPPDEARKVTHWAEQAAVPVTVAVAGERRTVGDLTWRVLGPLQTSPAGGDDTGAEGSAPNNASVVMLVRSHGLRVLMSGDAEPPEQGDILATGADLHVDVLKVAHHGSANQDPGFVFASQAPLAVISVGADNDYGHPSAHTLGLLRQLGARVYRTDQDGDIAIVKRAGLPAVVTSE